MIKPSRQPAAPELWQNLNLAFLQMRYYLMLSAPMLHRATELLF